MALKTDRFGFRVIAEGVFCLEVQTVRLAGPESDARVTNRVWNRGKNYLYLGLGWASLGLGVVGLFLPLLPTTPFLVLAGFAFSRGSRRLHSWLMNSPIFGPPIREWQKHRAISLRTKLSGTAMLGLVFATSLWLQVENWILILQAVVLLAVVAFLWSRPSLPRVGR